MSRYPIFPLLHPQRSNRHNTRCHKRRHYTLLNNKVCFAIFCSHFIIRIPDKMSYLPNLVSLARLLGWMELTDPFVSVCYRRRADGRFPLHEADVISMPSSPQQGLSAPSVLLRLHSFICSCRSSMLCCTVVVFSTPFPAAMQHRPITPHKTTDHDDELIRSIHSARNTSCKTGARRHELTCHLRVPGAREPTS